MGDYIHQEKTLNDNLLRRMEMGTMIVTVLVLFLVVLASRPAKKRTFKYYDFESELTPEQSIAKEIGKRVPVSPVHVFRM